MLSFSEDIISKKFIGIYTFVVYFICFIIAFPINSLYIKAGPSKETFEYDLNLANTLNISTTQLAGYLSMDAVSR
jgi:hypothetical protein